MRSARKMAHGKRITITVGAFCGFSSLLKKLRLSVDIMLKGEIDRFEGLSHHRALTAHVALMIW